MFSGHIAYSCSLNTEHEEAIPLTPPQSVLHDQGVKCDAHANRAAAGTSTNLLVSGLFANPGALNQIVPPD